MQKPNSDEPRLDEYFRQLFAGEIGRRDFEKATGREWW